MSRHYSNEKREDKHHKQYSRKPKETERVIIGESEAFSKQRANLLANAEYGIGTVDQRGKHLLYTVGSEQFGFIEYLILNAKNPR